MVRCTDNTTGKSGRNPKVGNATNGSVQIATLPVAAELNRSDFTDYSPLTFIRKLEASEMRSFLCRTNSILIDAQA